ncbi:DUF2491 family protein [Vibrio sp. WXL210]|uniref:DUF2491 family protein n=1 Tax=Vibrio sp. WXL210 TaxID=3450709 RepID=UPI003EC8D967
MFDSLKKLFGAKSTPELTTRPGPPELLGLRLGASLTIDPIKLDLIQTSLTIDGANPDQVIEAVGVVKLDLQRRIVRYYTDDEAFLQIQLDGEHIQELSLWYFFDTRGVIEADWQTLLESQVATGTYDLDGHTFEQSWQGEQVELLTETTYHRDGTVSETDQFCMAYFRHVDNPHLDIEMLLVSAEEKHNTVTQRLERELVRSTGFMLNTIDIRNN